MESNQQLAQLQKALEAGEISRAEYEAQRRQLLDDFNGGYRPAPATVSRSAKSLAVIGTRGWSFLSVRP